MKPLRHCLAALASVVCTGAATMAGGAAAPVAGWQCFPTGASAMDPALAAAAREYLGRVETIYPHQALGLVRTGERYYLLNSRDIEWGDRTRLHLLALRLQDAAGWNLLRPTVDHNVAPRDPKAGPTVEAERQAIGVAPGGAPPPGGFICLAASRAEREGLTRTPFGEIVLAAGQSVHLVNPQEPEVAVEVRAATDRPLSLGEIFQRSARAGIYAGLTGQARQPGGTAIIERPGGTLIFRTASAGGSAADARVAAAPAAPAPEKVAAIAPPREPEVVLVPPKPLPAEQFVQPPVAAAVAPPPAPAGSPRRDAVIDSGPVAVVPAPEVKPAPPAVTAAVAPAEQPAVPAKPAHEATPAAETVVAAVTPLAAPAPQPAAAPAPSVAPLETTAVQAPASPARTEVIAAAAVPAAVVLPASGFVTQSARRGGSAEQTYDEYAKAMKTLMALKRSGGVRSISEMTYVHPAVEVFRRQNP